MTNVLYSIAFLISLHTLAFASTIPIKDHNVYILNKSAFPITVKYVECTYSKTPNDRKQMYCNSEEIEKEIAGNSSLNIGNFALPEWYVSDGKFYAVTMISNNVVTKYYSTELLKPYEAICYNNFERTLLIIDDYKSANQIFCYETAFSGVQ